MSGPCSLSVRHTDGMRGRGPRDGGTPTVGGKIEYESLMRAISAPLPRPTATHSQTSRLSGCPSWAVSLFISWVRSQRGAAGDGGNDDGRFKRYRDPDGGKHFESLMSRGNPQARSGLVPRSRAESRRPEKPIRQSASELTFVPMRTTFRVPTESAGTQLTPSRGKDISYFQVAVIRYFRYLHIYFMKFIFQHLLFISFKLSNIFVLIDTLCFNLML